MRFSTWEVIFCHFLARYFFIHITCLGNRWSVIGNQYSTDYRLLITMSPWFLHDFFNSTFWFWLVQVRVYGIRYKGKMYCCIKGKYFLVIVPRLCLGTYCLRFCRQFFILMFRRKKLFLSFWGVFCRRIYDHTRFIKAAYWWSEILRLRQLADP